MDLDIPEQVNARGGSDVSTALVRPVLDWGTFVQSFVLKHGRRDIPSVRLRGAENLCEETDENSFVLVFPRYLRVRSRECRSFRLNPDYRAG
jgi:hypothetical protein